MFASARLAILAAGALAMALPQAGGQVGACDEASGGGSFAWEVRDFTYNAFWIYQNPAHLWAQGRLNYTLVNPATGREAVCSAFSTQQSDFFYGNFIYSCSSSVPGDSDETLPRPTFAFNGYGLWRLRVNETWTCNKGTSKIYVGSGTKDLDLKCNDTGVVQNPDWKPGQPGNFYSTRYLDCGPLTTTLPANVAIGV
ncbi:hypothetical protein MAPG_04577 [Magnaporthiopsis poae ATCC 64411]|uniref:AA1-like domain-containing protein n=1 Tax=Magnaporthiopsis poae (strain ATCC 64411 / 73-15) TaxID=644358 RepID=A0A0C4DX39_MAGP6|nr:hypothetical protein MAPG_04577 [Magnaporthiopsis poae ATCC 64411]